MTDRRFRGVSSFVLVWKHELRTKRLYCNPLRLIGNTCLEILFSINFYTSDLESCAALVTVRHVDFPSVGLNNLSNDC